MAKCIGPACVDGAYEFLIAHIPKATIPFTLYYAGPDLGKVLVLDA